MEVTKKLEPFLYVFLYILNIFKKIALTDGVNKTVSTLVFPKFHSVEYSCSEKY